MEIVNSDYCVKEIVENIRTQTMKERDDPFLTSYYYAFIERMMKADQIIIVGAGNYGRSLYKILEQNNIHTVIRFADNSCDQYESGVYGKKVLAIADAAEQNRNAYFVVTPQYYIMELIRQLSELCVSLEQIDCFIVANTGMEI